MATYYIDIINGNDENDGLSPEKAKKDHTLLSVKGGDSVLFKRGNFIRDIKPCKTNRLQYSVFKSRCV